MNEIPDKHEKLKSHEDEDDVVVSDSEESDSNSSPTPKEDSRQEQATPREKQPAKEGLASFFKTKAERERDSRVEENNRPDVVEQEKSSDQTKDTEQVTDDSEEATNENLTNEEVQEATLAIVDARTQEVGEELETAEPDSVDEFEALADAVFLESLQELASNESEMTPEVIDAAFDEALEDLSINEEAEEPTEEVIEAVETEETAEVPADKDDDPSVIPVASVTPPTPPVVPPVAPRPPTPPVAPPMPPVGPPAPPVGPPIVPPMPGTSYNYSPPYNPNIPQPNINTPAPIIIEEIHNHHSDLLLGAILGYIIGRRGGRKRTEKKLIPKIDKLEEQVKTLHDTILEKEVKIRKIARENAEMIQRKLNTANSQVSIDAIMERRKTRKEVKESLKRREILAKDPGVEKIGKFSLPALKVFHERRLPDGTENSPERKRVEIMNESELIEKAQLVFVHNLSVVEMYRRGRLTLESLRQITKEYLRSGPYEQTFLRELLPDPEVIESKRNQVANVESTVDHQGMKEIYGNQLKDSNKFVNTNTSENIRTANQPNVIGTDESNAEKIVSKTSKPASSQVKKMAISGAITGIVIAAIVAVALLIS